MIMGVDIFSTQRYFALGALSAFVLASEKVDFVFNFFFFLSYILCV